MDRTLSSTRHASHHAPVTTTWTDIGSECWWLSPTERTLIQPELLALRSWHEAPHQAIAARAGCSIGVRGAQRIRQALLSALTTAHLRISEPDDAEIVIRADHQSDNTEPTPCAHGAHIPMGIGVASAWVGPIVVPGRTPCLRCWALHRRDATTARFAPQSRTLPSDVDPLLSMVAVTATVAMIRLWIDAPHALPPQRWEFHLPQLAPRTHPAHPHPACGCLWQS